MTEREKPQRHVLRAHRDTWPGVERQYGCPATLKSGSSLTVSASQIQTEHLQGDCNMKPKESGSIQRNLSGCLGSGWRCSILLSPWSSGQDHPSMSGYWGMEASQGAMTNSGLGCWMKVVTEKDLGERSSKQVSERAYKSLWQVWTWHNPSHAVNTSSLSLKSAKITASPTLLRCHHQVKLLLWQ